MAKVNFVKKAAKDNKAAGIKKGDSYYWWSSGFRGPKRYSKTKPRRSQTESNSAIASLCAVEEAMEDAKPISHPDLASMIENWKSDIEDAQGEIQRYSLDYPRSCIVEMADGPFVHYADHAAVTARLRAELAEAKRLLAAVAEQDVLYTRGTEVLMKQITNQNV